MRSSLRLFLVAIVGLVAGGTGAGAAIDADDEAAVKADRARIAERLDALRERLPETADAESYRKVAGWNDWANWNNWNNWGNW